MRRKAWPLVALPVAAVAIGLALLAGAALAKAFTLQVAKNAKVTNTQGATTHEPIAVTSKGLAVYTLGGDSKSHPECTASNHCLAIWPPATVASAKHLAKAHGITGKLGVWHRDGFNQLTLNGHPLYLYAGDGTRKDSASGQGIISFGGIWRVVRVGGSSGTMSTPPPTTTTSTTPAPTTPTTTSPTTPYYP